MKFQPSTSNRALWAACLLLAAFCFTAICEAADKAGKKYKVQLIWGTNAEESPDKAHKLMKGEHAQKLGKLFKWKNYFLITEKAVTDSSKTRLSEKCEIQVKDTGNSNVQVDLWGKGKNVITKSQKLPKGELLTIGGDADGDGAWFILIKEVE